MSTVGVESTDRLADLAAQHRIAFVDAPISGSYAAAETATSSSWASGEGSVRTQVEPILDALGKKTVWLDHVGDGSLAQTRAQQLVGPADRGDGRNPHPMLNADFVPVFPLHHAAKDAELALSAAHKQGVELPLTNALLPRWHEAIAADHGSDDGAAAVNAAATTWAAARQSCDCPREMTASHNPEQLGYSVWVEAVAAGAVVGAPSK